MNEFTTSNLSGETGNLTLEKLLEVRRRIRSMPPVAQCIYFVDRPAQYTQLMDSCIPDIPDLSHLGVNRIRGIRVIPINSMGDLTGFPECCKTPGIWAAMSDGTFQQLDSGDKP